jgi:site-specific recombinase XerC
MIGEPMTQAQPYTATDEDVPLFFGVPAPAPQPVVLPLDLVPQQHPRETCTLKNQAERWLWTLEHRQRKAVAPSSLAAFRSRLRRVFSFIHEDTLLAEISNLTLKNFVAAATSPYSDIEMPRFGLKKDQLLPLTKQLSPASVRQLLVLLKLIIASAIDAKGDKLFPLSYNADFIDAPELGEQHQPCLTANDVEHLIGAAKTDQERLLYQVLATTGLRMAELQAVHVGQDVGSSWDREASCIRVVSSCFRDREIPRLKTKAAKRTVHIHSSVNELIAQFVQKQGRKAGSYLFQDATGRGLPVRASSVRQAMAKRLLGAAPHSFRRFRITFLRQSRLQEDVLRQQVGHGSTDITSLYSRPSDEASAALVEAVGIGFNLSEEK